MLLTILLPLFSALPVGARCKVRVLTSNNTVDEKETISLIRLLIVEIFDLTHNRTGNGSDPMHCNP
jgi:hypothetical protein